ncbi:hypothetical protein GCK72_003751 [Caenorhabditis remanei]|uniref:Uncharacterized protein n=3 Tax=Caenorhabditis TaxID=6237 RepID=E3MXA4_CAERE|nr:hypothetical protein GCK72_003751 [Caenorhabditis remanei]EFP11558.1 hypothetical protein CRE_28869 [Caenorhabditis remanei]KAF1763806.1 hypothetical protein GCK72_003751 [Caenorhabditis remanei]
MQSKSPMDGQKGNEAANAQQQLKKKSPEELAQMAIVNRAFSAESADEPPPALGQKRSESTLEPLNNQLKSVPLVKAFNSAENQLDQKNQKKK